MASTRSREATVLIGRKDPQPFAFAGLWEHWAREGESVDSWAIIVTEANDLTKPIHDRMPVILGPEAYAPWMDPDLTEPPSGSKPF